MTPCPIQISTKLYKHQIENKSLHVKLLCKHQDFISVGGEIQKKIRDSLPHVFERTVKSPAVS